MYSFVKKLFFVFLFSLVVQIPSFAGEISKLYIIKDTNSANVKSVVDFYSRQSNFDVVSDNQYSIVYPDKNNYYVTLFEQNGNDVYFYYYSPSESIKDYKNIISRIKNKGYSYKTYRNEAEKQKFYSKVKSIMNKSVPTPQNDVNIQTEYDFSDSAQERYNAINKVLETQPVQVPQLEKSKEKNKVFNPFSDNNEDVILPKPVYVQPSETTFAGNNQDIPAGLSIPVVIQSDIDTSSLALNDRVSAILQNDITFNNIKKAGAGSIVYGTVTEVKSASGGFRNGSLVLVFDSILTTEGEKLNFKTEPYNFKMPESNRAAKITGQVAGRAAAGAIGGLLMGLISSAISGSSISNGIAYGAAIGAGAGAVMGGISSASAKGDDVSVTEGTVLILKTTGY